MSTSRENPPSSRRTENPIAPWWRQSAAEAVRVADSNAADGLSSTEVATRRARYGPNTIASAKGPSTWAIAARQFADPMNIMLAAVVVVSVVIREYPVAVVVAILVLFNVITSTQQEKKARASVDALAQLQIPQARVVRDGQLADVPAADLVPGDIVQLEAGDLVPADGRIIRAASLEAQEASLTGESAPIAKSTTEILGEDPALGDRHNMLFQNTTITRGTATIVVTSTGMHTEMGHIATMLTEVTQSASPLQKELSSLTRVLGIVAWGAVALMLALGLLRGESLATVLVVGIAVAISAIPTGLPTFVQAMLSSGARNLAAHQAVVKNLSDVETLGATSAINSDKTGTLTLNQMTATRLFTRGQWFTIDGEGYSKTGALRHAAGAEVPDFTRLALGLCLNSDATVSDSGVVVGDPTEAALVVLAAKLGVDAEETRRLYPRVAEVPFDSEYKFMVTFHHVAPDQGGFVATMKGGPDVVLQRCSHVLTADGVVPIADARAEIDEANQRMSEKGLRVLAFAVRTLEGQEAEAVADPMAQASDFTFVALTGIIDPLRPEAIVAAQAARTAGIEVRMITGDHAVTAAAIGAELGLGPGAMTGPEIQALDDDALRLRIADTHVFGRVTPQDKLRLVRLMQERGDIVAMTGDAVNDAAALKQADVGVAMGSGSEVTKQAARMVLTDDNFGTLVQAIRLGRGVYERITSYVRYQMASLFSLLLLFVVASVFDINNGVPLTPVMVLYLNFFITLFPVITIILDPAPDDLMSRPPRDPKIGLANRGAVAQWIGYGALIFAVALAAFFLAPGEASSTAPNTPVTLTFVVLAFGSLLGAVAMRRDPAVGYAAPAMNAIKWLAIAAALTVASVEIGFLQRLIGTTSLTGEEWLLALGLAAVVPVGVELSKWVRRRMLAQHLA